MTDEYKKWVGLNFKCRWITLDELKSMYPEVDHAGEMDGDGIVSYPGKGDEV